MKKKVLIFTTIVSLILCFTACGDDNKGTTTEPEVPKIEKTVDAVAKELGLKNKTEKSAEMIGAVDGAGYDGDIEIYLYDNLDSEEYKALTGDGYDMMGLTTIKATAAKDGMVLIYTGDGEIDQSIVDSFNALEFK